MKRTKVMIVEDQTMHRQLFELYIGSAHNYKLMASVADATLAPELCGKHGIELVIMDVITLGGANGLDAAQKIKALYPQIKIIAVTASPEYTFLRRARSIGVESFWYKEAQQMPIIELMDRTVSGESIYPPGPPAVRIGLASSSEFTNRERDVLRELVEGGNNRAIAEKLGISEHAVHYHINNMLAKTGFPNRVKLAVMVRKSGFVINPNEDKTA